MMQHSSSILRLEVADDEGESVTLVGRVEVEQVGNREIRITLLPALDVMEEETPKRSPLLERAQLQRESTIEDASVEIDSVLDVFTHQLFGCVEEIFPKSALKKDGSAHVDRSVSFGPLKIDEYHMTLGDHPSATSGPPMALDWNRQARSRSISLEEYEQARSPRRKRRQLKIPYKTRRVLLEKDAGFSTSQVNQAWAEALQIRKQRQETLQRGLLLQYTDDIAESATRKFRRFSESMYNLVGMSAGQSQ